jgi:outer membrane protein TolC
MNPNLKFWLGYRIRLAAPNGDPGANFITAGFGMPLPWLWSDERWGSEKRAAAAEKRALDEKHRRLLDMIATRAEKSLAELARHRAQAQTYEKELLPAAEKTLQATYAAYQVNRASFADLFSAEVQVIEFERTLRMARANAALAALDLGLEAGAFSNVGASQGKKP